MISKNTLIKRSKIQNKDIKTVNKTTTFWIPLILISPALVFFLLFLIIPMIWVIQDSLETPEGIGGGDAAFDNYFQNVWTDDVWYQSMKNSFLYALIVVPTSLILSLFVSFAISNVVRNKVRSSWQIIFFLPFVTSSIALSLVFRNLLSSSESGILNWILGTDNGWLQSDADDSNLGLWSMIIYGVWHSMAFEILILTTAMLSIDKRLYDSACIDNASKTRQFFKITMPSLERTIWYLITIGLIGAVKVFPLALFNNDTNAAQTYAPSMLTYVYKAVKEGSYSIAAAASISLVIVVIIFNFLVKKIASGIQKYYKYYSKRSETNQINKFKELNLKNSEKNSIHMIIKNSEKWRIEDVLNE